MRLKRLGIDTYQEPVIYMRSDCHVCRAEGFEAQSRVQVTHNGQAIIATLNVVTGELLAPDQAGLSEAAWRLLSARAGDAVILSHPPVLDSLGRVRAKLYGKRLGDADMRAIVRDIAAGRYADIHLSAFIAACAGDRLDLAGFIGAMLWFALARGLLSVYAARAVAGVHHRQHCHRAGAGIRLVERGECAWFSIGPTLSGWLAAIETVASAKALALPFYTAAAIWGGVWLGVYPPCFRTPAPLR